MKVFEGLQNLWYNNGTYVDFVLAKVSKDVVQNTLHVETLAFLHTLNLYYALQGHQNSNQPTEKGEGKSSFWAYQLQVKSLSDLIFSKSPPKCVLRTGLCFSKTHLTHLRITSAIWLPGEIRVVKVTYCVKDKTMAGAILVTLTGTNSDTFLFAFSGFQKLSEYLSEMSDHHMEVTDTTQRNLVIWSPNRSHPL
jgi:hypothetical protein